MCGIVGYFGSTGNNLTRPLTAMSSIVYRAPDSTGIGFFGDDLESIRTRKSLGFVSNLIATLLNEEAYPNRADELMSLWALEPEGTGLLERQRRLLAFEGFSLETFDALLRGDMDYPTLDDLLDSGTVPPQRLSPGWPGRVGQLPVFVIRSKDELKKLIRYFINQCDLSLLAIEALLREALSETLATWQEKEKVEVESQEILHAFDALLTETFWEECGLEPSRLECGRLSGSPFVEKTLWNLLLQTEVRVPSDYDRDGVRCIFRLLDAALLCRLPHKPELHDQLQHTYENLRPNGKQHKVLDWKTLYWAEKGVNVYGWAAASALAHLHQKELLPELSADSPERPDPPEAPIPGRTDPAFLHYLSSPIIAHGRWALQAPVTLRNAHPFLDGAGQRAVVLNGQFSAKVEAEIRHFLEQLAGYSFRSQNSSEYFALLWGYYAKLLQDERNRFEAIRFQIDEALEEYIIGSQAIDYKVYHQVRGRSTRELDEMAFVQAARVLKRKGGQVAVAGISLESPRRLYVASHNRPVFVVRHLEKDDFMVVSDINAALGLFPQSLIYRKALELDDLRRDHVKTMQELRESEGGKEAVVEYEKSYKEAEQSILEVFGVTVYPLEGEEIFACIEAGFEKGDFFREVRVTDFNGAPLPKAKSFHTLLNPHLTKKDPLFGSFYESHLREVPERLDDILRTYAGEKNTPPRFDLHDRSLHRQFGHGFIRLKRILLVGMGSSHNAGLMARDFLQRLLPELEVLVLRPVEIENISNTVVPENDLVVLLSWSSTTADMVQFAKDLEAHQVLMLAFTEKPFADMALIARKSAGVIRVLSGEEVTVAGIKSTLCMLFCLELWGLWLTSRLGRKKEALDFVERLKEIPAILVQVLSDGAAEKFTKDLASRSRTSYACLVFDALESTAAGHEIALKLQENSWVALGKSLDYQSLLIHGCEKDMDEHLILVNATHEGRLREALNLMKRLHLTEAPFAAVSYAHPQEAAVRYYSKNLCLNLPKVEDSLQPLVDLMFFYSFAYHYGLAHGRTAEDAPRNRAKSVTVGRSRPESTPSPEPELQLLEEKASQLIPETAAPSHPWQTTWEEGAWFERERLYYSEIRRMTEMISRKGLAESLLPLSPEQLAGLSRAIFEGLPEEGEIVFVSLDRSAHAAAKNVMVRWQRFLQCFLRVAPAGESLEHFKEDTILIFVATKPPGYEPLFRLLQEVFVSCLWIGPEISEETARFFQDSLGCVKLGGQFELIENELLYAGLSALFLGAWKERHPEEAQVVEQHFKQSSRVVQAILNDDSLRQTLHEATAANKNYRSAYFCGPPDGVGLAWVERFDQTGCLFLEHHLYRESAYGPLVTVDPRVDKKFIPLEPHSEMVSHYGEDQVSEWKRRYLGETSIDTFLKDNGEGLAPQIEKPFYAEGQWYLPVLRPDYDAAQDNLIIIDAASDRHFDYALDELATYGIRYARMVVITQRTFLQDGRKRSLQNHPISHVLLLPSLEGQTDEIPIPDLLVPFAMNLLGMGLSAAAAQIRNLPFEPFSLESLFEEKFGPLGEVMIRHGINIDYLSHHLIDFIKNLAPVVCAVEGIGRYAVSEIETESQLHELAAKRRLYDAKATLEHFRAQQSQEEPFYLVRPDRSTFEGKVFDLASRTFHGEKWGLWHEVYGDPWWVLYNRTPGIQETFQETPLLMLPFLESPSGGDWLYHLYLRFAEWNHRSPLEEQLRITTRALGKKGTGQDSISSKYREIVSHFNAMMVAQRHLWDDGLLILVKRSLLFGQPGRKIAQVLVERVQSLLDLLTQERNAASIGEIVEELGKAWPALQGKETLNDTERWDALRGLLTL